MSDNRENLSNVVRASLGGEEHPTQELIRERVNQFRGIRDHEVDDDEAEQLCREIEASLDISMAVGAVVQETFVEWLDAAKAAIHPYYWERYRRLLEQQKFPSRVIARMADVTDRILGLLENPEKSGPWDRRGMVVGHVQSGKTANYTGVICKAADAGYKLIVIIAGIHNNLRNQTQARIDEGFVGRDSGSLLSDNSSRVIGAGRFDATEFPLTVTNTKQDFNKNTATILGVQLRALKVPAVLVIKKRPGTLKRLIDWLKLHNAQRDSNLVDAPMLLIDDEADNASIDISPDPEKASATNSRIRELLEMFNCSCYIGYTATPFANIFIEPDSEQEMLGSDLFPRDFVISLEASSNYFGASRMFGYDAEDDVIMEIDDHADVLPLRHKNFHEVTELPRSLLKATRTFVLARAVRMLRGQTTAHNSMLVNVSRFTSVQAQIRNDLHHFMDVLVRRIRFEPTGDSEKALADESIAALHRVWTEVFPTVEFSWSDVFAILLEAAAPVSVIEINSRSAETLDYKSHEEHGRHVIAVGGFSLSRGLTLEGLTVSYFLRNSIMYDTLMQMGRWFGYRSGYEDVCRVWMTGDARGWYEHITESIEELRAELRAMEQAKLTPREFGLKVRSHPDSLIVTARNKMGTAQSFSVRIGLSNKFIETHAVPAREELRLSNIRAARELISEISQDRNVRKAVENGTIVWRHVTADQIRSFLASWTNQQESMHTAPGPVSEYITRRNPGELAEWDVALIGLKGGKSDPDDLLGPAVRCQIRTVSDRTTRNCILLSSNMRVAGRGAEKVGLNRDAVQRAEASWDEEARKDGKKKPYNIPDHVYRRYRERPLLMVHLLTLEAPKARPSISVPDKPVVAWGISFPKSGDDDPTVEYIVNTTWLREAFPDDTDEEEPENGEAD